MKTKNFFNGVIASTIQLIVCIPLSYLLLPLSSILYEDVFNNLEESIDSASYFLGILILSYMLVFVSYTLIYSLIRNTYKNLPNTFYFSIIMVTSLIMISYFLIFY